MVAGKKKPPVLVKEATFFRLADIHHAVSSLDEVEYEYFIHGKKTSGGRGWVIVITYNAEEASTIVIGKHLFINPRSFDYAQLKETEDGRVQIRLIADDTELRLTSCETGSELPATVKRLRKLEEEGLDFLLSYDDED